MRGFRGVVGAMKLVVIVLGLIGGAPQVRAQETDSIAKSLSAARSSYELRMQALRDHVSKELDKAGQLASKAKDDAAAKTATVNALREAFKKTGAWPTCFDTASLRQDDAKAAADMDKAYAKAIQDYGAANKAGLSAAVTGESQLFRGELDVVPWSDDLVKATGDSARTVGSDAKLVVPVAGLAEAYRVEIKARRSGEAGVLRVEIPLPGGKRVEIPALMEGNGTVHVMLTVGKENVSADLGVARPVAMDAARVDAERGIVLRADGGGFVVEFVRVKALVKGQREQVAANEKKPGAGNHPTAKAQDSLQAGDKLSGKAVYNKKLPPRPLEGTLTSMSETVVVIRTQAKTGSNIWRFTRDGNTLTLVDVDPEGGRNTYKVNGGRGTINGTHISWNADWDTFLGNKRTGAGDTGGFELDKE